MRKKQSQMLYSNNMPVHPAAYSFTKGAAKAGLLPIGFILTTQHNNQEINISISLPSINRNTG
jgi:hypothetical protein